jgi:hypothetical protein
LASLSGQVFSEMPAFLLAALGLRAVLATALAGWDFAALLVSVALLPWFHPKFSVLAAGLLGAALVAHRGRDAIKPLVAASGLLVASVLGLSLLTQQWFHSWVPGAQITMTRVPSPGSSSSLGDVFAKNFHLTIGYIGILFDQQSGLFFASPVYLLAIPGVVLLWRRNRSLAIICALVVAAVYVPAASWGVWYGGQASPALDAAGADSRGWHRGCARWRGNPRSTGLLSTDGSELLPCVFDGDVAGFHSIR